MGFPKQEYWSGLPLPSPEDLPDPRINLHLLQWREDSLALSHHIQDQNCVKGLRIHCQNSIFFLKKVCAQTKSFVLLYISTNDIFLKNGYSGRNLPRKCLQNLILLSAATTAARSLQSCLTLCDPIEGTHQAPPSLGFSRQEHWSGLPFPSPMHESEKWKGSRSVMSDSSWSHGLQPTRLLSPWDLPGKSTGVGCHLILLSTTTINLAKDLYYDMSPFLWLVYISKFAELPLIFSCIVPPLSFFKLLHKTCFYLNWCQYLNCYKIMCFYTINTLVPGFLCWLFQLLR